MRIKSTIGKSTFEMFSGDGHIAMIERTNSDGKKEFNFPRELLDKYAEQRMKEMAEVLISSLLTRG